MGKYVPDTPYIFKSERRAKSGEAGALLLEAISYTGDKCIHWPFGHVCHAPGTPRTSPKQAVRAFVCINANGPPPHGGSTFEYAVATSCDDPRCITPAHLSWRRRAGEKQNHSPARPVANKKLFDVAAIAASNLSNTALAKQYGVTVGTIGKAKKRHDREVAQEAVRADAGVAARQADLSLHGAAEVRRHPLRRAQRRGAVAEP